MRIIHKLLVTCSLVLLVACQKATFNPEKLTLSDFKNLTLVNKQDNAIQRVIFENSKMIVTLDLNKDVSSVTELLQKTTKLESPSIQDITALDTKVATQLFDAKTPGYQSQYGTTYIVFYNPTISAPQESRSTWVVEMDYEKDSRVSHRGSKKDTIFNFTITKDALEDSQRLTLTTQ